MQREGDSDPDAIFMAVGRSLSEWEQMEESLMGFYTNLLDARTIGAQRGYGLMTAFTGRIALVRAAELAFPGRDWTKFKSLRETAALADNLSSRRNDIAHGHLVSMRGEANGYFLVPSAYNPRKEGRWDLRGQPHGFGKELWSYAYNSAQILTYAERFIDLHRLIRSQTEEVALVWGDRRHKTGAWPLDEPPLEAH
jgi:hypothetical protein